MRVPWLRLLDLVLALADMARGSRRRSGADSAQARLAPRKGALGRLEARVAGVFVAALGEAFDREARRLDLERERIEAEQARAERALRLELLARAGEREIGRLRFVAGAAVASWVGTLVWWARAGSVGGGGRVAIGLGWLLLLAAITTAFSAQARVARALDRIEDRDAIASGLSGALAPWLMLAGLALIGVAILVS